MFAFGAHLCHHCGADGDAILTYSSEKGEQLAEYAVADACTHHHVITSFKSHSPKTTVLG